MNNCNCEAVADRMDVISSQAAAESAIFDTRVQILESQVIALSNELDARIINAIRHAQKSNLGL